jgi:ribosome-associated translation inhibitor RaiA
MKIERDADDLYKAIDKVRDHLRVELSDWKKRMEERSKAGE